MQALQYSTAAIMLYTYNKQYGYSNITQYCISPVQYGGWIYYNNHPTATYGNIWTLPQQHLPYSLNVYTPCACVYVGTKSGLFKLFHTVLESL